MHAMRFTNKSVILSFFPITASFSFKTQEYWQLQKEETKKDADTKAGVKRK